MRLVYRRRPQVAVCNAIRAKRYGYQLRCLEPRGHDGEHRWTPELVADAGTTGPPRPRPVNRTALGKGRRP